MNPGKYVLSGLNPGRVLMVGAAPSVSPGGAVRATSPRCPTTSDGGGDVGQAPVWWAAPSVCPNGVVATICPPVRRSRTVGGTRPVGPEGGGKPAQVPVS